MLKTLTLSLLVFIAGFSQQVCAGLFSPNSSHYLKGGRPMELFDLTSGKRVQTVDLKADYDIGDASLELLTHDAKYLVVTGYYKEEGLIIAVLNLAEKKIQKKTPFPRERIGIDHSDRYRAIPNTQDFVTYYRHSEKAMSADLVRYSAEGSDWKPVSQVRLKCEKRKGLKGPHMGELFMGIEGKFLAIKRYKAYYKHNLNDLTEKAEKLSLPRGYSLSPDLTACYHEKEIHSLNFKAPEHEVYYNRGAFIDTEEKIYYTFDEDCYSEDVGGIFRFDYGSNKELEAIKNKDWYKKSFKLSPSGRLVIVEGKVYQLRDGKFLFAFQSDEEVMRQLAASVKAEDFSLAESQLSLISEKGKKTEAYRTIAFKVRRALKNDVEMAKLADEWGANLPAQFAWDACEAYGRLGKNEEALNLIEELQASDIRRLAGPLEKNPHFSNLTGQPRFVSLVKATQHIDDIDDPKHIPTPEEFEAGVGLFELYTFKAYAILARYKELGLDEALQQAEAAFTEALEHAFTPVNRATGNYAIAKVFLKVGESLEAINYYEAGIAEDPDNPQDAWVDAAAAYLDIKNIIEEELRSKPRNRWNQDYLEDYRKVNKRAQELCTAVLEKQPGDPFALYIRAKTHYSVDQGTHRKKRIADAKAAKEGFTAQGISVPIDCSNMASSDWDGPQPILKNSSTGSRPATSAANKCNTRCGSCRGSGRTTESEQCNTCLGSGKRGSCYACNGRGRKYFTSNIQFCHTCSGKGYLTCFMCNGMGLRKRHSHCGTCKGTGFSCN